MTTTTKKTWIVVSSDGCKWSRHSTRELAAKMLARWALKCSENPDLASLTFSIEHVD